MAGKIIRPECTDGILTDAVDARTQDGALVNVILTMAAGEALQTRARVVADAVDAGGSVLARILGAFVDVLLAHGSGESDRTPALVAVDQIETLFAIRALDRETFVDVVLAVKSFESCPSADRKASVNVKVRHLLLLFLPGRHSQ